MEWQSCNFLTEVEKPVMEGASENEKKETQVQYRFANPKSAEEVNEMRATAVPKGRHGILYVYLECLVERENH